MTFRGLLLVGVSAALLFVHRADVLAASGWVLLTPPVQNTIEPPGVKVDVKRPYSEWSYDSAFDTARECESEKIARWDALRRKIEISKHEAEQERKQEAERWKKAIEALPKGKENWDDQDWNLLKHYAEYLRTWDDKYNAELIRDKNRSVLLDARFTARCIPTDVLFSSQPKK